MSEPGRLLLAQQGRALRLATWQLWSAIAGGFFLPIWALAARGSQRTNPSALPTVQGFLLVCLVASAIGLFAKPLPVAAARPEDAALANGVKMVRYFWTTNERRRLRQACWVLLAVSLLSLVIVGPGAGS